MHSVPSSPGEDESGSPESQREDSVNVEELWETFWIWYVRSLVVGSMVLTLIRLLQNNEVRLQVLHRSTRLFGDIARVFGSWAIQSEKAYYDVADSIPH